MSLSSVPDDTILPVGKSYSLPKSHLRQRQEASAIPVPRVTFIAVKGIGSQAQGSGADAASEALTVEKVTLGTQPLHHKHALLTEVAGVAAAQAQGKGLSHGFLRPVEKSNVLGTNATLKARPRDVEILNQIPASSGLLAAAYVTADKSMGRETHSPQPPPLQGLSARLIGMSGHRA